MEFGCAVSSVLRAKLCKGRLHDKGIFFAFDDVYHLCPDGHQMDRNLPDLVVPTVNTDLEVLAAPALAMRYETLVRMSRAIGAHRDLKELFGILMDELHGVVQFDFIGVSLRDQDSDTFRNYFIDMASRSELLPEEQLIPEETLTLWVYDRQEPLLRSTEEMEPCYGRLQAILKRLNIRSICALPLTTAHRKLGAITFGSKQADTYSPSEIQFVSQVVDYIALAFDDALNFAALRRASEELQSKNDRLRLLLDVTNQVVSNLELRDLLRAISHDVRRVMQCDYAGLSLPDAENKQLRLYALDFPAGKGFLQEELVYSMEGTPSGTAFRTMKPLMLQSPFTGWLNYPIVQIAVREGLKSVCCLPLISRNRAIGVLVLGRLRDDAFSQADIEFLSQVANQFALAVENALAYREIRELKEQLSKEKLYLEDEIRTEMNFAQIIGNSASLRRVLKGVGTVAPTDSTVLIYGETGTGKELIARSGRDRRNSSRIADQAASRVARKGVRAAGKLANASNRCALDCRDEPRFRSDGERAEVPIRSLLSLECFPCACSAVAGTPGGYSAPGTALHAAIFQTDEKGHGNDSLSGNGRAVPISLAGEHTRTSECNRACRNCLGWAGPECRCG